VFTAKVTKGDIIQQTLTHTVNVMRAISPFLTFAVFDVRVSECYS